MERLDDLDCTDVLEEAIAEGDCIHTIIKDSAINTES